MKCPYCKSLESKVTNKRDVERFTRRRRECLNCGKRFTTHEKSEPVERFVIKKDGRREIFQRDKLFLGVIKACEKRDISHDQVDKLVCEIEEKLLTKRKEISTDKIGEAMMKKLKKLDNISYIRFASVYKDFHDANDFKKIVKEMEK
ncbi:MAG: transcriptional regulator NrdR [Nanoarchaeota archaeon]|nr:transcriptional regulator NrdR [Nanoarchaeota archaeon]